MLRDHILILLSDLDNAFFLGPMGDEDSTDFINAKTHRIPYKTSSMDLCDWKDGFR